MSVFRPADDCRKKWTVQLEATYTTELATTWEKAMKSIRLLVFSLLLVVIALMLSSTVYAHHPYSDFDNEKTIKIEGKVVQYLFVNPTSALAGRGRAKAAVGCRMGQPWSDGSFTWGK